MHQKENNQSQRSSKAIGTIALGCALATVGCQHYNAINFVTNTQVGAKVGVNAEKIPEIQVGYNRQEAARVPVYLMSNGASNSSSTEDINSILSQTQAKLEEAKAKPDGSEEKKGAIKFAQDLIDDAVSVDKDLRSTKSASPLLKRIQERAGKLSGTSKSGEFDAVNGLIAAEISKQDFHEQAKFIGSRKGDEARDAYSVLGTFSGDMSGSSTSGTGPEAKLKGGIVQYFATGVAAQELAKKGGAALVSTAANPPGRKVDIEALLSPEHVANVAKYDELVSKKLTKDVETKNKKFKKDDKAELYAMYLAYDLGDTILNIKGDPSRGNDFKAIISKLEDATK